MGRPSQLQLLPLQEKLYSKVYKQLLLHLTHPEEGRVGEEEGEGRGERGEGRGEGEEEGEGRGEGEEEEEGRRG